MDLLNNVPICKTLSHMIWVQNDTWDYSDYDIVIYDTIRYDTI